MKALFLTTMAVAIAFTMINSPVFAAQEGDYSYTQNIRDSWSDGSIRYTLKLKSRGNVELITETTGRVEPDRNLISSYGEILDYTSRWGRVVQTGTWRNDGHRLTIDLTRISGGRQDQSLRTRLQGRSANSNLYLDSFDSRLYGRSTSFNFQRISKRSSNDTLIAAGALLVLAAVLANDRKSSSSSSDARDVEGEYTYRQTVNRDSSINYRLELRRNGRAELISRRDGELPRRWDAADRYGRIVDYLYQDPGVSHSGTWRRSGSTIIIDLTDLRYSRRTDRVHIELRGNISREQITIPRSDRDFYGRSAMVFRRW